MTYLRRCTAYRTVYVASFPGPRASKSGGLRDRLTCVCAVAVLLVGGPGNKATGTVYVGLAKARPNNNDTLGGRA